MRRPIRLPSLPGVATKQRCVPSPLEELLYLHFVGCGLHHGCEREYVYAPGRRFRADFAFPAHKLLVECQGGVWSGKSGHSGGAGITKDIERGNAATLAGWRVLRFAPAHIRSGEAVRVVQAALALPYPFSSADPSTGSDRTDTPEASPSGLDGESIRARSVRTAIRRGRS